MEDIGDPNTADIVAILRGNTDSLALLIIRNQGRVVNLEDSPIRVGVNVGEPFRNTLVRRHEERVAIHLVVNYTPTRDGQCFIAIRADRGCVQWP